MMTGRVRVASRARSRRQISRPDTPGSIQSISVVCVKCATNSSTSRSAPTVRLTGDRVKSGGFTAHNTTNAAAADPFEPEKLTAFEIGVKADIGRTLRFDAATFYYRYKDQQILGKVLDPISGSYIGRFVNADSRISGAEAELEWRPLAGVTVSQYVGYAEGYYTRALLDSGGNDYDGRPESFPKWTYGGDLAYAWPLGDYELTAESNHSFHDTYT